MAAFNSWRFSADPEVDHPDDIMSDRRRAFFRGLTTDTGPDVGTHVDPPSSDRLFQNFAQQLESMSEALNGVPARYSRPIREVLSKLSNLGERKLDPREVTWQQAVKDYSLGPDASRQLRTSLGLPPDAPRPGKAPALVDVGTAQKLRSAYFDLAHDYSGNVPKQVQSLASQAGRMIDDAMQTAAEKAGTVETWRSANGLWKQLQENYNDTTSPIYHVLQEADAVRIPDKVLAQGSVGGSPRNIRILKQEGIDLGPIKREVVSRIAAKGFERTANGRIAGYSEPFLKELFEPAELQQIERLSEGHAGANPGKFLRGIVGEDELGKVAQRVTEQGSTGGLPERVRMLREIGANLGPLKRQVVDNIANRSFRLTAGGNRLSGYSIEFLHALFEPEELAKLQKMARVAQAIRYEQNPSGTSNVMLGEGQVRAITDAGVKLSPARLLGILPEAGAAKVTLSPSFREAAMEGPTGPEPRVLPPGESLKAPVTRTAASGVAQRRRRR